MPKKTVYTMRVAPASGSSTHPISTAPRRASQPESPLLLLVEPTTPSLPLAVMPAPLNPDDVEAGIRWINQMYCDADRLKDSNHLVSTYLIEDAVLVLANAPEMRGRKALEGLFNWKYGGCRDIEHRLLDVHIHPDRIMASLHVTYRFRDGRNCHIKCFAVWHKCISEQRASKAEIYGDFHEVYEKLKEVQGPPPLLSTLAAGDIR